MTAWISSYTGNVLRQVTIDDKIQTIKEILLKIYDMAITKRNNIILSMGDSSDVKMVTKSGEIKPIFFCGTTSTNLNLCD